MNHASMERAALLKGKEDAPNYRKATGQSVNCKLGIRLKLTTQ